jgi:hypothetical protein
LNAAGGAGGSVAKGAMLVFERDGSGTVTARVSASWAFLGVSVDSGALFALMWLVFVCGGVGPVTAGV